MKTIFLTICMFATFLVAQSSSITPQIANTSIKTDTIIVHKEGINKTLVLIDSVDTSKKSFDDFAYISNHWIELVGLILGILAFLVPIYKFFRNKNEEQRDRYFKTYHELIKQLVQGEGEKIMLDRQLAIIFELRNYPTYYELSERILLVLKDSWKNDRISKEVDLTVKYINKYNKKLIVRIINLFKITSK